MSLEPAIGACHYCGAETKGLIVEMFGKTHQWPAPTICLSKDCKDKEAAEAKVEADASKRFRGETLPLDDMPPVFKDTDTNRIHPKLKSAVEQFDPTKRGQSYLLHGGTRHGKSRAAWEMVKKTVAIKHTYKVLTMRQFEAAVEQSFHSHTHGKLLETYCCTHLLVLDDLGKEQLTKRLAADLFAVVDDRTQNLRNTVITTNLRSDDIEGKFGADKQTAAAFVARLREYFFSVGLPNDVQ